MYTYIKYNSLLKIKINENLGFYYKISNKSSVFDWPGSLDVSGVR